ncbi:MAG TPA: hypothetical protein VEZ71_23840, partial [Archangium sp.]|nr:hypothetical protein [Archangium sp.]
RPRPYLGRMVLVEATERAHPLPQPLESLWRPLVAGGLEHHRLPGDHSQLVREPHVEAVAELIQRVLSR